MWLLAGEAFAVAFVLRDRAMQVRLVAQLHARRPGFLLRVRDATDSEHRDTREVPAGATVHLGGTGAR